MNPSDATEEYAGRETATMPHGVDNANSLSETSSLNSKHVRRMSSIADHRAQKAQAVSKREANAAPVCLVLFPGQAHYTYAFLMEAILLVHFVSEYSVARLVAHASAYPCFTARSSSNQRERCTG